MNNKFRHFLALGLFMLASLAPLSLVSEIGNGANPSTGEKGAEITPDG